MTIGSYSYGIDEGPDDLFIGWFLNNIRLTHTTEYLVDGSNMEIRAVFASAIEVYISSEYAHSDITEERQASWMTL